MALFNWQNGNKTQNAVVTSDGVTVQDAVWEGETPLSASNLNAAQNQLVEYVEGEINSNIGTETNTWSSASSYSAGDRVIYAGGVYKNLTGNNSSAPNIDTTNWELVPIIDENGHINEQDIYSTTEVKTNKTWINGKPLYRKVLEINNLPNSTSTSYAHNISNIDLIYIEKAFWSLSDGACGPIPQYVASSEITSMYVNKTNVVITTNVNYSSRKGYVVLEYTKSS